MMISAGDPYGGGESTDQAGVTHAPRGVGEMATTRLTPSQIEYAPP
jgi:hypothetical protein